MVTVIAWTLAIGFNVEVIKQVATVLVISCPQALGLSIPLVVAITTTVEASKGVLVRDRWASDVGIAISSGTDVVIESAGIIPVKSNPMDVYGS